MNLLFSFLLIFASYFAFSQTILLEKTAGHGEGYAINKTHDGGFIITGFKDIWLLLLKTDSLGDTLWSKRFGMGTNPNFAQNLGYDVIETKDHGFIVVGVQQPIAPDHNFYVIKTDSIGNKIWQNVFTAFNFSLARNIYKQTTLPLLLLEKL